MSKKQTFISLVCQIADDDSHGYDQTNRWGPDFDCTSLCYYCAHHAGYNVPLGSGYSGTLRRDFAAAGWTAVEFDGNIYDNPPGSIMLREGHHAEVVISSGQWAGAHINERGTITGGASGDQTGREINRCNPYHYGSYPNDWDYVIMPPEEGDDPTPTPQPTGNWIQVFTSQWWSRYDGSTTAEGDDFAGDDSPIYGIRSNCEMQLHTIGAVWTDWGTEFKMEYPVDAMRIKGQSIRVLCAGESGYYGTYTYGSKTQDGDDFSGDFGKPIYRIQFI